MSPLKSPHGPGAPGAGQVGWVHVPGVVAGRSQWSLPGHVAPIVSNLYLDLHLHLQFSVVLLHGPRVRALLCLSHVDIVRIGWIHHLVPLLSVQQEALQRNRVLLGHEEGSLRQVLARWEHLPGAFQVEQDAGPAGVVHVPVVFQKSVVEQAIVPEADGLEEGRREGEDETTGKKYRYFSKGIRG